MPIKGLTDQPRAFVELGQLRKGAKKTDPKRPGSDLTYFRPKFNEDEDEAAQMFQEAYGNEPKAIEVFLPFDEPEANFETWKEVYLAGGLVHRCDGENVWYAINPDNGEILVQNGKSVETGEPVPCFGFVEYINTKGQKQAVACKPEGRLKVIVPALRRLAYMTVITHSIWDIVNLSRQLEGYRWENQQKLRGVRFVLKRRPKMISTPSGPNGKRARRKKSLLCIEPAPSWVEEQLLMREQEARPMLRKVAPLELPPGVPDTNGDVIEEIPFDEEPSEIESPPLTMLELKARAETELGFENGDIREAIETRLRDEFGDDAPTAKAFRNERGEERAARWFWIACRMEHELRQAPPPEDLPF